MKYHGQYKTKELKHCRVCGMDSGARKVTVKYPERFYVVCETCGFKTRPHSSQAAATREWNSERKDEQIR
jgi:hypothetical protein